MKNQPDQLEKKLTEEEIIKKLTGELLFTSFGNTEYAGYVFYDKEKGLYFKIEREGMKKSISFEEAEALIKNGQSANFIK